MGTRSRSRRLPTAERADGLTIRQSRVSRRAGCQETGPSSSREARRSKAAYHRPIPAFYLMEFVHLAHQEAGRPRPTRRRKAPGRGRCSGCGRARINPQRDLIPPVGFGPIWVCSTRETPGVWRWRHRPTGHETVLGVLRKSETAKSSTVKGASAT